MEKGMATDRRPPPAEPATVRSAPQIGQLNAAQQARVRHVAREAALLYPDDPTLQRCAVEAAIDYLCGDADLGVTGAEWHRIRQEEKRLRARVRQLAVMSVADKTFSERAVALAIGLDRMRLRRWSGKPTSSHPAGSTLAQEARR